MLEEAQLRERIMTYCGEKNIFMLHKTATPTIELHVHSYPENDLSKTKA